MNKFEKMMSTLNLYEEENKKLLNLKQETKFKIQQLNEEFETWKNTYELKVQKEEELLLKEKSKIEIKNQKLEQELKEAPAEKVSEAFLNYIETTKDMLNKQLQKNKEMLQTLNHNSFTEIKEREQTLNKKINEFDEQVKLQENEVKNNINLVKENALDIKKDELEIFLIDYLKQATGKTFSKMDDESIYQYERFSYSDRDEWKENFYFKGLKCTNEKIQTAEELIEGIKNKKIILFFISQVGHSFTDSGHRLFILNKNNGFEDLSENDRKKLETIPYLTFLQNENLRKSYFKIYPDLKEKLFKFMENKFIKEEETILNNAKNYITNLKNNIDTNEEQMNNEIKDTIEKIKEKYAKQLKDNKIQYFQLTNEYNTKKEELNAFISKGNKTEKVEEELEK